MQSKLKWKTPGHPTRFRLYYPPARSPRKTEHWDNWVAAMMMDTRLNSTDRAVLTRLALHYNLKTGDCFPAVGRIAIESGLGESGWRTVLRTISKAAQLGWIERTTRKGGAREKNQTNLYELRLPESIIKRREIGLKITGLPGAWQVAQVTDGMVVCGPFKDRANAEKWVAEHGPTCQTERPTCQIPPTDLSNTPYRPVKYPTQNREVTEQGSNRTFRTSYGLGC